MVNFCYLNKFFKEFINKKFLKIMGFIVYVALSIVPIIVATCGFGPFCAYMLGISKIGPVAGGAFAHL